MLALARKEKEVEVRDTLGVTGTIRATLSEQARTLTDDGEQRALMLRRKSCTCQCYPHTRQGTFRGSPVMRLRDQGQCCSAPRRLDLLDAGVMLRLLPLILGAPATGGPQPPGGEPAPP